MLRPRWAKVVNDLWNNRARTLVVALAVAVGVYAVGSILATQTVLLREFHRDRSDARIASAILTTFPFDDGLVDRIAEIPGVRAAEGRTSLSARVIIGPDTTRNIQIVEISDFADQQVDRFLLVAGTWPAHKDEIMLERLGLAYIGAQIGDTITVELSDNTRKELTITGTAHNPQDPSPDITGRTAGLVSLETMVYLGQPYPFDEIHLAVDADPADDAGVRAVVDAVQDHIERSGREVISTTIIGESIIESIISTAVLILSSFGWIILLLSAFLVINTVSALIAQQVNQIGIMKLVGASRLQMMAMYIAMVLIYGIIAFLIGIPLAVGTAYLLMTRLIEDLLNLRPESYAVPWWVYGVMVAVGVLIPVAAGLLPVWQGTQITTYAALNPAGAHAGAVAGGRMDHLLARLPRRWVQRPFLLAMRNALRHKGRLLRTTAVMILGTALFIGVISVRESVDATQADFLRYHQYDVQVQFEAPQRIERVEGLALAMPGVVAVESWDITRATRLRPDGSESNRYLVYGLPAASSLVEPVVQKGRWLLPADGRAVVINASLADQEPDIGVGDTILLDLEGRERDWLVVGIVSTDAQGPKIYMNYPAIGHETHRLGRASSLQVVANRQDSASQDAMEAALLKQFEARGFDVRSTRTTQTLNAANQLMFDVIVSFLILLAVLLGAVGSLGLSTTMGINMIERIREIGVLRAIGASNAAIRRIVLMEGVFIAIVSWVFGFALSFPAARFMSEQIGIALLDMPLTYAYAGGAAIVWLFVLVALAVLASLGPARRAVRLTVREVLAYE